MQKPSDFENATRQGEFKRLPADGYICKIMKAQEGSSKSGKPMVTVAIDIADGGEYDGYFRKQFEGRVKNNPSAKWPCFCYIVTKTNEGNTSPAFKNFVECLKESNGNFQPTWDDTFADKLKSLRIGVVFCEEEYMGRDGKLRVSVKPDYGHFVNLEQIRNKEYTVPERKKYEGNSFDSVPTSDNDIPEGFEVIDENEIPF